MNLDIDNNRDIRKKYIEKCATKIYEKFGVLFPEGADALRHDFTNRFLDTDMSYDEISKQIFDIVTERSKENRVASDYDIREKRKRDIDDLVENIYNEYSDIIKGTLEVTQIEVEREYLDTTLTIDEIKDELMEKIEKKKEEIRQAKENEKKIDDYQVENLEEVSEEEVDTTIPKNEEVEEKTEPLTSAPIENTESKHNLADMATGFIGGVAVAATAESQSVKNKMAGLIGGIGGVSAGSNIAPKQMDKVLADQVQTYQASRLHEASAQVQSNEVNMDSYKSNTGSELNDMLNDSSYKAAQVNANNSKGNSLGEKPKQFVKTAPLNNNQDGAGAASAPGQAGNISLFSIGLSLLIITGAVLLAMILNIILK